MHQEPQLPAIDPLHETNRAALAATVGGLVLQILALGLSLWVAFGVGPWADRGQALAAVVVAALTMLVGVVVARRAHRPAADVGTVVATLFSPLILTAVLAYQQIRGASGPGAIALSVTVAFFALIAMASLRWAARRAREREVAAERISSPPPSTGAS